MMNKTRFYFLLISFLIIIGSNAIAQPALSTKSKKAIELYTDADNYRVRGKFANAIEMLKEALKKDKNFYEAWFRLGLTYKNAHDLKNSAEAYEHGLTLTTDPRRQSLFHYDLGDVYMRSGNYAKALSHLDAYLSFDKAANTKSDQVAVWRKQAQFGIDHLNEDLGFKETLLSDSVNTFPMQYFPVLTADNNHLIFVGRNGHRYEDDEDIFISTKDASGRWGSPVSISSSINTAGESQGTCTVSADGRHLILAMCGGKGYGECDLFESRRTGDSWSVPTNLGPVVNGRSKDTQPALSADGQELYFVSDRKGGVGGLDIWYTRRDSTGRWVRPINAGPVVNTKYDEISPFIHVNNRNLYFASNAHPGFGGFDIFVSERGNKTWSTPKNMGAKLNNFEDQYSFFVTADGKLAYYAKDEAGKDNVSKLYMTTLPEPVQVEYYSNLVIGKVRDKESKLPLQAQVELRDIQKNERVSMVRSDSVTGEYTMVLTKGAEYALYSTKKGYLFNSLSFNYASEGRKDPVIVNIDLQKATVDAMAVLNNIFFETGKYDLNEKSNTELHEIIEFLKSNPTLRVEIGGHTDNVGTEANNQILSQKRAQSVVEYLSSHGIDGKRIGQKGYGSLHPVRPNDSDENRQFNRRIEFKIIK